LLRGEKPTITVSLAVPSGSARRYAIYFAVRTPDGIAVLRHAVPPTHRTRFSESLDLSAAPPAADRLELETAVIDVQTGLTAFRAKTPLRLVASPWSTAEK
jgi:hypothetical protein